MKKLTTSVSAAALALSGLAFAQTTTEPPAETDDAVVTEPGDTTYGDEDALTTEDDLLYDLEGADEPMGDANDDMGEPYVTDDATDEPVIEDDPAMTEDDLPEDAEVEEVTPEL